MTRVAFCIDNNFVEPCAVAMRSVIEHTGDVEFEIIVDRSFTKKNMYTLASFVQNHKCSVIFATLEDFVDIDRLKDCYLPKYKHFTKATYYRLFLPELIQYDEKVVYLDGDLIVKENINELLNVDLKGAYIGASEEQNYREDRDRLAPYRDFGPYINTGVMIMDIEKMREDNITDKFIECIKEFKNMETLKNVDQDIINITLSVIRGEIALFDKKWNVEVRPNMEMQNEYESSFIDPYIIHYVTEDKPWKKNSKQKYIKDWEYYRNKLSKLL